MGKLHKPGLGFACASLLFLAAGTALAGTENAVPSCYKANYITPFSTSYDKLVYVLIDQTVQLDATLKKSVLNNMLPVLDPGTKFVVADFSAFSQGRYLQVLKTGIIESPIPPDHVGDVVMTRLQSFRTCMKNQKAYARNLALKTAYTAMAGGTSSLDHSDILMALKTVAATIRNDHAKQKLLFLVSDGVENSTVTSFYAHNSIRRLNVNVEMSKVKKDNLLAKFGSARVYVLGGAYLPPARHGTRNQREGYRNPLVLMALKRFWSRYFVKSGAHLVEFGTPTLVSPVHF